VRTDSRPLSDLTARARIVDAATAVFAEQGASASVRAIAAAAGVSPALITHHFGTKDALKAECDQRVLDAYTELKMAGIASPATSLAALDDADEAESARLAVMSAYMLRAFMDGGDTAREFYRRLLAQVSEIMHVAADHGMVRRECVDDAHLRYLAAMNLGFMVVQYVIDPPATSVDFMRHLMSDPGVLDAMLDVLTNGVFANEQVLTVYRQSTGLSEAAMGGPNTATDGRPAATQRKERNV